MWIWLETEYTSIPHCQLISHSVQNANSYYLFLFFTSTLLAFIIKTDDDNNDENVLNTLFQVRDQMAAEGMEPLEEEIPNEDIIGRDYCRLKQQIGAP